MKETKVYLNGKLLPLSQAALPVMDRGFLYGDGVFESLRTYGRQPFLLEEHIKRLLSGARSIRLRPPLSAGQIRSAVLKTLAANNFKESYIKIILTRGVAKGHGLALNNTVGKPNFLILVEELKDNQAAFIGGWKIIISSIKKAELPTARLKSLCYLDNALALAEAKKAGANEALLLDHKGHIAEGSVSNIFLVKLDNIYTPPAEEPILAGITRNFVIKLARQSAFRIVEKPLEPKDLYTCDECFLTMSGSGIVPVVAVWNRKIGKGKPGPITSQLQARYQQETSRG
jgi:branched-chain amino acid aminotransferase